jgi:hypothetical protein
MRCEAKRAGLCFRFCFCVAPFLDINGFRHEAVESSPLVIGVILGAPPFPVFTSSLTWRSKLASSP